MNGLYQVSNLGRIKGTKREVLRNGNVYHWKERILTPQIEKNGYIRFILSKNGKMYRILIHRAVAEAFIENKENKPQVNHKNGNKKDNTVKNLEWVTAQENTLHSLKNGLRKPQKTKKIIQLDEKKKFIKIWNSAREAGNYLNINHSLIYECCRGKIKKAGNYIWEYESGYFG